MDEIFGSENILAKLDDESYYDYLEDSFFDLAFEGQTDPDKKARNEYIENVFGLYISRHLEYWVLWNLRMNSHLEKFFKVAAFLAFFYVLADSLAKKHSPLECWRRFGIKQEIDNRFVKFYVFVNTEAKNVFIDFEIMKTDWQTDEMLEKSLSDFRIYPKKCKELAIIAMITGIFLVKTTYSKRALDIYLTGVDISSTPGLRGIGAALDNLQTFECTPDLTDWGF